MPNQLATCHMQVPCLCYLITLGNPYKNKYIQFKFCLGKFQIEMPNRLQKIVADIYPQVLHLWGAMVRKLSMKHPCSNLLLNHMGVCTQPKKNTWKRLNWSHNENIETTPLFYIHNIFFCVYFFLIL